MADDPDNPPLTDEELERFRPATESKKPFMPGLIAKSEARKDQELKMWLAIRTDLDMPPGKLAVQSGHAFFGLCDHMWFGVTTEKHDDAYAEYQEKGSPKIAVRVDTLHQLERVRDECLAADIPVYLVQDAGRTVFHEPTYTVCAFGPARRSELPPFLKRLQLYE